MYMKYAFAFQGLPHVTNVIVQITPDPSGFRKEKEK